MLNLGLNEALISLNKSSSLIKTPIEVYYKNEECFGCSYDKLTELNDTNNNFKINTQYNVNLRLKLQQSVEVDNSSSCQLNSLSLNSQAHYQINIFSENELTSINRLNCNIETLDSGECLWCPFAILICIIFAFVTLEWIYATFLTPKRQQLLSCSSSSSSSSLNSSEPAGAAAATSAAAGAARDGEQIEVVATAVAAQRGAGEEEEEGEEENSKEGLSHAEQSDEASSRERNINLVAPFKQLPAIVNKRKQQPQQQQRLVATATRIECLDAFRGLTIAGMIFVNYGGAGYSIWEHKPWNGITLADFVFPFFIFSMGTSIAISVKSLMMRKRQAQEGESSLSFYCVAMKIIRRSLLLMILGLCLNSKWLNYEDENGFNYLRLTGVLQRFSISYLVVALMFAFELLINKWIRAQSLTQIPYLSKIIELSFELLMAINYLALYIYVTFFFEYNNNCPIGYTGPGGLSEGGKYFNCTGGAAAWLDQLILGENHLYNDKLLKEIFKTKISHDPEGILGYTTSILLTLIGLQCGKILISIQKNNQNNNSQQELRKSCLISLIQWIILLTIASSLLVIIIPINKRLWSLSFITLTALAAFVLITILYILLDIYQFFKTSNSFFLMKLFISAGKNPIFLYVGHSLIHQMLPFWFPINNPTSHLQLLLRTTWATLIWLLIANYMAKKNLYIKV